MVCSASPVFPVFELCSQFFFQGAGFSPDLDQGPEEASMAAVERGEALVPRLTGMQFRGCLNYIDRLG